MYKLDLNGSWSMERQSDNQTFPATIPGSVYSVLLENQAMADPFYRDNELDALKRMDDEYTFTKSFGLTGDQLEVDQLLLRCDGLDTLCDLWVNDVHVGQAFNMHRHWEFNILSAVQVGENTLKILFHSPTRYIKEAMDDNFIGGATDAMAGFPYLRKAHCMFGWDWGPRLPDAGIWRNIYLLGINSSRICDVKISQRHTKEQVYLKVQVEQSNQATVQVTMKAPDGQIFTLTNHQEIKITDPQLWWPNGYGNQPLYTIRIELQEKDQIVDSTSRRIGLRTMTLVREKDQWGESFAHCVNGLSFFAMGADYIPEDNIFSRITPERTRKLLEQCVAANFNVIRVWGGGYYPDNFFYDICDELGLVVWQDFMFACANYLLTKDFSSNIRQEFIDNVTRLRHHPSLGLWCGNNEMEQFQIETVFQSNEKTRSDYIRMFEHIIPEVLEEYDPDTYYWPASPSSGGGFDYPNDPNRGDVHYWDVWHGGLPFTEYRKNYFRYASEFGFQSFPCLKTVESFTLPEDRNIFSRVMEMHQRNVGANGKILSYLSQTFLYPTEFASLLYASQILQAEAIRNGVEHWRRNRGRCMGAIYWQLNDIWPVASWASIDYFGRWKALHYYAKRFFSPLLLSCDEIGEITDRASVVAEPSPIETSARLSVANESRSSIQGEIYWALRNPWGKVLQHGQRTVEVAALTSLWLDRINFPDLDFLNCYLSYELEVDGQIVSKGSSLFTAPKHFNFQKPTLTWKIEGNKIKITSDVFAKSIEISSPDTDLILSDNFFDCHGNTVEVEIIEGQPKTLELMSVYNIR